MTDRHDVQSLVLEPRSRAHLRIGWVAVDGEGAFRRLVQAAAGAVTTHADLTAPAGPPAVELNVGITAAGLRLLRPAPRTWAALSPAFTSGMATAAGRLGDRSDSAPVAWGPPFDGGERRRRLHAAVLAFADDRTLLERALDAFVGSAAGIEVVDAWDGWFGTHEAFGFRDRISDPVIEGSGRTVTPGNGIWDARAGRWRSVRAGEAVLGQVDESGAVSGHPDARPIERNGSYLVIRKLRQHVEAFHAEAKRIGDETGVDPEAVEAQFVGRHKDGRVLGLEGEPPGHNDFRYRDPAHPVAVRPSAHIRRANPRDALIAASAMVPRHQLFRRGYRYGPLDRGGKPVPGAEQGIVFMACCADLERQFEFVQSQWIQDGNRFGLGDERDPVAGHRPDHGGVVDDVAASGTSLDLDGRRRRVGRLANFVTVRGGEYLLPPARSALARLARWDES